MRTLLTICAVAISMLVASAGAQDLVFKAPKQTETICLYNASIHPVVGPEIKTGFLVFSDGVITEIGEGTPSLPAPGAAPGYVTIDCDGKHLYPGLIAPWTQLGLTEIQAVRQTNDLSETGGVTPEVCPANAVNPDSTLLPITRSNGVLVAGVYAGGGTFPGQVSVIRLDGWTTDELTISPAVGQVLRWPSMRTFSAWWMDTNEDEQRKESRKAVETIERVLDTAEAYHASRSADSTAPTDIRWESLVISLPKTSDSDSVAKPMFVLANDADQINAAVSFGKQRGLRMVIVGGREADQCAELLKQENVPVIVTGTHLMPARDDAPYDAPFTLPARLAAAGVRFTIANADDTAHERNTPYSVATAVKHGLDHAKGLESLTIDAARILGIEATHGSLEKGKSATIIVTTGDPMEVRTQITSAYIDGRLLDLSNKQTELAKKYRERLKQIGK